MSREFFSFGDEDLTLGDDAWDRTERSGGTSVIPPEGSNSDEQTLDWDADWALEEAQRSRGDSDQRSSENREPPSMRAKGAIVLVLLAGAVLVAHLAVGALGGQSSRSPSSTAQTQVKPLVATSSPGPKIGDPRAQVHRQSSRRPRAQSRERRDTSRRRARRRRARHAHNRRRQGPQQEVTDEKGQSAASEIDSPPVESPSSTPEPSNGESQAVAPATPPPEPSPPTPTEAATGQFGIEGG